MSICSTLWLTYTDKKDGKTYTKSSKDAGATWSEAQEMKTPPELNIRGKKMSLECFFILHKWYYPKKGYRICKRCGQMQEEWNPEEPYWMRVLVFDDFMVHLNNTYKWNADGSRKYEYPPTIINKSIENKKALKWLSSEFHIKKGDP